MKKGRCFIMRVKLKRVLSFVSAVVIGGVSCVTTWFSVPVSAAGAFGMLEWLEFQTLLQGIGVSGNNSDFADSVQDWIDGIGGPEMPRYDYDGEWMTNYQYYSRVGWDAIVDWFDGLFSGDNAYSDISDVGTDVSVGGNVFRAVVGHDDIIAITDVASSNGSDIVFDCDNPLYSTKPVTYRWEFDRSSLDLFFCNYVVDGQTYSLFFSSHDNFNALLYVRYFNTSFSGYSSFSFSPLPYNNLYYCMLPFSCPFISSSIPPVDLNLTNPGRAAWDVLDALCPGGAVDFQIGGLSSGFVGPVYTYPAAQDLYKSTGTAAGIRLDVQTQDGVPDIQAALDGAGVDTVDDLVAGVAAGTVPMSKVFSDAKVTPYVVADTATGAVVTDLGVSATAAGVKAVGLTQELAVPKDLTNAAAYPIKGKTWDPDMAKYKLPLFQFFPFCLPWDIYEVLTLFDAEPVAPKFTIPVGQFFTRFSGSVDTSKAADQKAVIDLGADSWQSTFKVIRALECAAIIIGLCLTAVLLIHGGR